MKTINSTAIITNPSLPIQGVTGWTYGQAVRETIEMGGEIDIKLYPFAADWSRGDGKGAMESEPSRKAIEIDDFERRTGWAFGDVVDLISERNRERRIFGHNVR